MFQGEVQILKWEKQYLELWFLTPISFILQMNVKKVYLGQFM